MSNTSELSLESIIDDIIISSNRTSGEYYKEIYSISTEAINFFNGYDAFIESVGLESLMSLEGIGSALKKGFDKVVEFFRKICKKVAEWARRFWNWVKSFFTKKEKKLDDKMKQFQNARGESATEMKKRESENSDELESILKYTDDILDLVSEVDKKVFDNINKFNDNLSELTEINETKNKNVDILMKEMQKYMDWSVEYLNNPDHAQTLSNAKDVKASFEGIGGKGSVPSVIKGAKSLLNKIRGLERNVQTSISDDNKILSILERNKKDIPDEVKTCITSSLKMKMQIREGLTSRLNDMARASASLTNEIDRLVSIIINPDHDRDITKDDESKKEFVA